jgi:hypothetical protein
MQIEDRRLGLELLFHAVPLNAHVKPVAERFPQGLRATRQRALNPRR